MPRLSAWRPLVSWLIAAGSKRPELRDPIAIPPGRPAGRPLFLTRPGLAGGLALLPADATIECFVARNDDRGGEKLPSALLRGAAERGSAGGVRGPPSPPPWPTRRGGPNGPPSPP